MKGKNEIKKTTEKIERALNAVILQSATAGISSFVFGFKDEETSQNIIHFEKIPVGEAMNICAFGWVKAIRFELDAHPEYKKDYSKIFEEALVDFERLTKKINKRVAEYNLKLKVKSKITPRKKLR